MQLLHQHLYQQTSRRSTLMRLIKPTLGGSHHLDSKDPYSELLPPEKHSHYKQGVGFINYATSALRPDLAYAAGQLSQVLHQPRERHYKAMFHCVRYMKGTANLSLHFSRDASHQLLAYIDSDYARCKGSKKLVSRGIMKLASGPIHWFSKKQENVTLSCYGSRVHGNDTRN